MKIKTRESNAITAKRSAVVLILLTISFLMTIYIAQAEPGGPTITYLTNSSSTTVGNPTARAGDDKGTITTMLLNISQQSNHFKAYVGNVSGRLTLDDSANYTIFDWTLTSIQGEVYATRNSASITWSNVICANDTVVAQEMTQIGHAASATDNLNKTFNFSTHNQFQAGGASFATDQCDHTTYLYQNDTAQFTNYQEVLLWDGTNIVYTALLEDADTDIGYNWRDSTINGRYDFQMLVGENATATDGYTYYFYVELS